MLPAFYVLLFLALMVCSGELFVRSIIKLSSRFQISSFALGATVVTAGTAAPDLFFAVNSSCSGHFDASISALTGSVITNILLCTGFASLISGIRFDNKDENLRFNMRYHLLFFVIFTCYIIYSKGVISHGLSIALLSSIVLFIIFNLRSKEVTDVNIDKTESIIKHKTQNIYIVITMILIGVVGLYISSSMLVSKLVILSDMFNIPKKVISATVISLGNSMPEIITAILASFKKQSRFILGNIVGSNVITFSIVIGFSALISKFCAIGELGTILPFLFLDLPFVLLTCLIFYVFFITKKEFGRIIGLIFIFLYLLYILLQINII